MKTLLLISIIAAIGISLTALVFVYQHIQNCDAQGGSITGLLKCDKTQYRIMNELFQKKFSVALTTVVDAVDGATQEMVSYDQNGNSMTLLIKENLDGPYYAEILCKYNSGKTEKITKDIVSYLENGGCFRNQDATSFELEPKTVACPDSVEQLTMEVWHCGAISAPTKMQIQKVEGFDICGKEDKYYTLRPGQTGKMTYTVYRGNDMNDPPYEPEYREIASEYAFLHEFDHENGRTRESFVPDGINFEYESDLEKIGFNQTATITVTVSVDSDATEQTMWLGLPPFTCGGGSYEKFAIIK